jgi:hypothetical protein
METASGWRNWAAAARPVPDRAIVCTGPDRRLCGDNQGRELAAEFLAATAFRPGWTARLIPARANGQPAFGFYARDPGTGSYYTVRLMVLTLSGTQISAMTRFDPAVLPRFGLPSSLSN